MFAKRLPRTFTFISIVLLLFFRFAASAAPESSNQLAAKTDQITIDFWTLVQQKIPTGVCSREGTGAIRCTGPVRLSGLTNLNINGDHEVLSFLDASPGHGGLTFDNAENVDLHGLEIGWEAGGVNDPMPTIGPPIQSLGRVLACSQGATGGSLELDRRIDGVQPIKSVSIWDDARGWPWYGDAPPAPESSINVIGHFQNGHSECFSQLRGLIGRRVLVRHITSNHAFVCNACNYVALENVRVTSAPGMAFVFQRGGRHLVLRNNSISPKCSPSCRSAEPSVVGDGAHFGDVGGDVLIEGNDFGWQGDDSVNVAGNLLRAEREPGTSKFIVIAGHRARTAGLSSGATVSLFDVALKPLGHAHLTSSVGDAGEISFSDADLPAGIVDLVFELTDHIPVGLIVRNNHFHDHRARGILIGASNAVVENNVIERVTMNGILIEADTDHWYEGPAPTNVAVRHNKISEANRFPTPGYPSVISAGVDLDPSYHGAANASISQLNVEGNETHNIHSNPDRTVNVGSGAACERCDH